MYKRSNQIFIISLNTLSGVTRTNLRHAHSAALRHAHSAALRHAHSAALRHAHPHFKDAAVASRWQRVGYLIGSGFEPQNPIRGIMCENPGGMAPPLPPSADAHGRRAPSHGDFRKFVIKIMRFRHISAKIEPITENCSSLVINSARQHFDCGMGGAWNLSGNALGYIPSSPLLPIHKSFFKRSI